MQLYFLIKSIILLNVEYFQKRKKKALKSILDKKLKIIIPKQMLQRFPIALAQVKVDNKRLNTRIEIKQIIT